ncbi:hypothetical protein [Proteiniclasticum sp.]|jgi:hypothetical protein|uniref:hypothetical protein n=1 Tax=Proteiniclasticum sp. TaxID=2053595 RepID=UPI0025ED0A75|nr:hypothetical protein [Proteiniclasticum sp.]
MDYLIILLAVIAVVTVLKIVKSAFKFVLTAIIILFALYYMDMQGFIDLGPFLDALGI